MRHGEPWTLQWHLIELDGYDNPRSAHSPAGRPYRVVLGPHRQVEPVTPFHGNETLCREVHAGRSVGGHHRKSSLHRDNVHGLPRSIQDEALMFKRSHKFKCLFFLAFLK
jgi:hypothetical protein